MKRKTVGQRALEARSDRTVYDPYEIGEALTNDILKEVWKCIDAHQDKIQEPEFCIVMLRGGDPLIQGVERRKFYAWPFLPKPRPMQLVMHYSRKLDTIQRLWSLPTPRVMAVLSETIGVSGQWMLTKVWCDAFFKGFRYDKRQSKWINKDERCFYDLIRNMCGINMPTESEFLNMHRSELVKLGGDDSKGSLSDSFDFSKIAVKKVVDPQEAILN